jgi:hypothetical protein
MLQKKFRAPSARGGACGAVTFTLIALHTMATHRASSSYALRARATACAANAARHSQLGRQLDAL